ncbi:MAG: DUF1822 family protein [Anaerolineae bacterium]|nr:DUF1822 family protein [Gloeobacterales cyanobacterium ES-bin-313]
MKSDLSVADPLDPNSWWLDIAPTFREPTGSYSTPAARWNAFLNQAALKTLLPWLRKEYIPRLHPWPEGALMPTFWECCNGTAINNSQTRIVLIPSEAVDIDELRVPQEWVDIPNWVADFYLAVQVDVDGHRLRVWGYTTHKHLKECGEFDHSDRSYNLAESKLLKNLNAVWVAREFEVQEVLRSQPMALPALRKAEADHLLELLGTSELCNPRMEVSFARWGALLEHGGWRKRLYEKRVRQADQWSVVDWLTQGMSAMAQEVGWRAGSLQLAGARGAAVACAKGIDFPSGIGDFNRSLRIAEQIYTLQVIPEAENTYRFRLTGVEGYVPRSFTLRLLTEDLRPFPHNEVTALENTTELVVTVIVEPDEGLVWEIEPTPEDYERETLKF